MTTTHRRLTFTLAALAFSTVAATAQINPVSCEFSPNVAQIGGTVEIRMWNNTQGTVFQSGACDWFQIFYSGADGRPDLSRPVQRIAPCTLQIVFTPAGTQINANQPQVWNLRDGANPVPAGKYWVRSRVRDANGGALLPPEWFCLTIQAGPGEPTMTQMPNDPPQVGQSNSYSISVPSEPNQLYGVLFSFSSNNPIGAVPLLGFDLCVGSTVFDINGGFQALDASGNATFSFTVPNQAALAQEGFQLQAVVTTASGTPLFTNTNAVSNSIRP